MKINILMIDKMDYPLNTSNFRFQSRNPHQDTLHTPVACALVEEHALSRLLTSKEPSHLDRCAKRVNASNHQPDPQVRAILSV